MASSPDGRPLGESPEALLYDSVNLMACTVVPSAAYGIMLTLYGICAYNLWSQMTNENRRRTTFYLGYITTMAILGTLYIIPSAWIADLAYVKHRMYVDGPGAYSLLTYSRPSTVLGCVSCMLINFMADGLVLWRFIVLYRDIQPFYLITIVPCLMYIGCICFGLLTVIQPYLPESSFRTASAFNYTLIYLSLSISLTCLATLAMLGKLYYHRRHIRRVFGKRHGTQYTGIAAMLVESAALHALFCLVFIILYGINNTMQWIFLSLLSQVQIIAPLLIIFRVSQGRAWSRDTHSTILSSIPTTQISSNNVTFATSRSGHETPTTLHSGSVLYKSSPHQMRSPTRSNPSVIVLSERQGNIA